MSTAAVGGAARAAGAATAPAPDRTEQLRRTAQQLEGVFVEQLFKAMRETVPEGGLTDGGSGEEMFNTLLDQKLSAVVPTRWNHGLVDSLVRQLGGAGAGGTPPASAPPSSTIVPSPILHPNAPADASSPEHL